ncbi:MAG TPA: hypothetical protein VGM76_03945, partial [Lacipirellulaceae bacterium]
MDITLGKLAAAIEEMRQFRLNTAFISANGEFFFANAHCGEFHGMYNAIGAESGFSTHRGCFEA